MYNILKVERNQGKDRYFQLVKTGVADYFLDFSLLKEPCMPSSGIYIPAKASKGEGANMDAAPTYPSSQGQATLLHPLITNPANFIPDYLCFFMSGH